MAKGYYHRSFVILQPRDGRFNITSGKTAAGHCKIEVKNDRCKMSFHVQDLKPQQADKGGYDIFLVSAQNDIPCLKIASIFVDERGRGECTLELDINHVAGSDYSLDQFHGLALVCNDPEDIKFPLVGYANKRVGLDWAGRIKRDLEKYYGKEVKSRIRLNEISQTASKRLIDEKEAELYAKEVIMPEHKKEQPVTDTDDEWLADVKEGPIKAEEQEDQDIKLDIQQGTVQPVEEQQEEEMQQDEAQRREKEEQEGVQQQQEEVHHEAQQRQEEERQEGEQQELQQRQEEEQQEEIQQDEQNMFEYSYQTVDKDLYDEGQEWEMEKPEGEQVKSASVSKDTYWERVKEYYTKLFEYNRKVYPFDIRIGNVEWVEIPQASGYNLHGYISSPYYYSDDYGYPYYDHYIVGIMKEKDDVRYIIYGIPSTYTAMPPIYMQGFSTWLPVRNGYGMGYWLLYIDARTGEIAYPY